MLLNSAAIVALGVSPSWAADDAAVSAPVLSVTGLTGSVGGNASGYLSSTATVPIDHSFGAQLDSMLSQNGERGEGGLGVHAFWRDPDMALVGATAMWSRIGGWNVYRTGGEAELYLDDFTLSPSFGMQSGDAQKNGRPSGYGTANAAWYATDDLKLNLGITGFANSRAEYTEIEWQPAASTPFTVLLDGGGGENNIHGFVLVGIRYTFGSGSAGLKDRDRHGDPENIVSFTNAMGNAVVTAAKDVHYTQPYTPAAAPVVFTCCFIVGTQVLLADGTSKAIENLRVGDMVVGAHGVVNRVRGVVHRPLRDRLLYSINGSDPFISPEHPLLTTQGWKAFDPAASGVADTLTVGTLQVGDVLITTRGPVEVRSVKGVRMDPDTQLCNLDLDGDQTYTAQGFVAHNYEKSAHDLSGFGPWMARHFDPVTTI